MADEEKTVDIDTSGPGAEVELPIEESTVDKQEDKTPAEDKSHENERETKLEDGGSTDDTSSESDKQSDVPVQEDKRETKEQKDKRFSEEEIKKYGFNVKRRINKEVAKRREAERQRDEVSEYTKIIMAERDKLKNRLEKLDTNYVSEVETRIKAGVQAATAKLAKAREDNDIKSEIEAQKEISRLGYEEARLADLKASQTKKESDVQKSEEQPVPQQRPPIDEKTQEWIDNNKSWFGKVKGMTATAYDIHDDLMGEGYEGSSDDYFNELDRRLRLEFPSKFDKVDDSTTEKAKPAQTVASAKRPAATGRNKTVSLTPTEVAIARRIGVSLEDYAREKYAKEGRSI